MFAVIALWASYGCLMVAVYTGAMDMVRPGKEGTDFTLQIVLTHISGLFISVFSGKMADVFGYSTLFGLQACLSLLALLLLMVFKTLRPTLNKPLKQAFNS
jgi:MFS family permease